MASQGGDPYSWRLEALGPAVDPSFIGPPWLAPFKSQTQLDALERLLRALATARGMTPDERFIRLHATRIDGLCADAQTIDTGYDAEQQGHKGNGLLGQVRALLAMDDGSMVAAYNRSSDRLQRRVEVMAEALSIALDAFGPCIVLMGDLRRVLETLAREPNLRGRPTGQALDAACRAILVAYREIGGTLPGLQHDREGVPTGNALFLCRAVGAIYRLPGVDEHHRLRRLCAAMKRG